MGITCKPIGKFKGIMTKMQNELERQERLRKKSKEQKVKK